MPSSHVKKLIKAYKRMIFPPAKGSVGCDMNHQAFKPERALVLSPNFPRSNRAFASLEGLDVELSCFEESFLVRSSFGEK